MPVIEHYFCDVCKTECFMTKEPKVGPVGASYPYKVKCRKCADKEYESSEIKSI